jgi:uncharacterized membrane protein
MYKLSTLGRFFLAIAMVAFGAQHFVYLDFVTRVFPSLPAWIPGRPFLACVFGALLLASGAAIMIEKAARPAALLLGAVILSSFALLYLPLLITTPPNGGLWTAAGKALALSGGSFLVAGSLPVKLDRTANAPAGAVRALEILHIPRAVAMSGSNETTAVIEALAMSGAVFLVAASPISGSS